MTRLIPPLVIAKLATIKAVITDVDGVLTPSSLFYRDVDDYRVQFSARDGFAIKAFSRVPLPVVWLTGRGGPGVLARASELSVAKVIERSTDKVKDATAWCQANQLTLAEILYIGDDQPDCELLLNAGLSACPADAHANARLRVDWVLTRNGGDGCMREIYDTWLQHTD